MEIILREACPDDAEQLVLFVQRLSMEPGIYRILRRKPTVFSRGMKPEDTV